MDRDLFIQLLHKKLTGRLSQEEAMLLETLVSEKPEWKAEMELLSDYWKQRPLKIVPDTEWEEQKKRIKQYAERVRKRRIWIPAIAASLLLLVTGLILKPNRQTDNSNGRVLVHTAPATNQKILLPDGSYIILNANSTLAFDSASFAKGNRIVTLHGGGYCSIAKDPEHPFLVQIHSGTIKVLGTEFNIEDYGTSDRSEIALLKGKIEFQSNRDPDKRYTIHPNEKIVIDHGKFVESGNNVEVKKLDPAVADGRQYIKDTSWMQHVLMLQNDSLAGIAQKIQERFGVKIIFATGEVRGYTFSGQINISDLEQTLNALKAVQPFQYYKEGDQITISR